MIIEKQIMMCTIIVSARKQDSSSLLQQIETHMYSLIWQLILLFKYLFKALVAVGFKQLPQFFKLQPWY